MTLSRNAAENVHHLIRCLIEQIGDDPNRDGLQETPLRVMRSWGELYSGYRFDPRTVFKVFDEGCDEMVIIKDVEFYSTCEHHMIPFFGKAHIAYLPQGGRVIGASKLPRLLEGYSRRLQIQERIGMQVTETLMKPTFGLNPKGAACVLEAKHLCMCARGVGKQNAVMVTSSLEGAFRDDPKTRAEFLQFIRS